MKSDVSAEWVLILSLLEEPPNPPAPVFAPFIEENLFLDQYLRSFSFMITLLKMMCDTVDNVLVGIHFPFLRGLFILRYPPPQQGLFNYGSYVKQPIRQRPFQL